MALVIVYSGTSLALFATKNALRVGKPHLPYFNPGSGLKYHIQWPAPG